MPRLPNVKTALVTGVSGQDGVYLARSLCAAGYRVVGTTNPAAPHDDPRLVYLDGVERCAVDVSDGPAVRALLAETTPDEVYNLAAQSSVGQSWADPEGTRRANLDPVEHLVAALIEQRDRTRREPRLFQASSAEVRASTADSPYARAKADAEAIVRAAREDHGLFAVCGLLHNHESPLRGPQFVTRRISIGAAEIALGRADELTLGNLDVKRDWGFAGDHVEAMRLLLGHDEPLDLAIGTGVLHSLSDLLDRAFDAAGLGAPGSRVRQDPDLARPSDTPTLVADPEPAARLLGWRARVGFDELIGHLVATDLERLRSGVAESPAYLYPS